MRIEIAGAKITDAVVKTLDKLQNQLELTQLYIKAIDEFTRMAIFDISDDESGALSNLRMLQMIRYDLLSLAMPPATRKMTLRSPRCDTAPR